MATVDTLQLPFMLNPPTVATQSSSLNGNPYFQYFGTPQTYQPLTSYEAVDQTLRTFPEALKGQSTFLERTFTLLALTQNAFLTSVILPIKYTNDTHFTWSQWIFHPYLPERVPHLGVVRFVKSQTQTKTKALTRFGIGMTLEHGFMETELGRQHYVMEIRQITQAINEGLQAEALYALMNSQSWELNRLRQLQGSAGNVLHTPHVDAIIQRELDTWAYMQQNRHAWFGMNDHVARAIETYSQGGFNAWIIDIRVDSFRKRVAEDQTTFAIHGPGFLESLQQGAQHYQVDPNGKVIYATRSFLTGERPINPLESSAQIGEYVRCADLPDMNFDEYDSSYRTQKIYDEDYDVFKDITLRQKLQHCHRFNDSGTLKTYKDLRIKVNLDDDEDKKIDFLHYVTPKKEVRPLSLFGQLRQEHFDTNDYRDLARTVFSSLSKTSPYNLPAYEEAFATLRRYIEDMNQAPYDNKYEAWVAALALWNQNTSAGNTGANAQTPGVDGVNDIRANGFRSLDMFPSGGPTVALGQWRAVPPTHSTYGGFKTIQDMFRKNNGAYAAVFNMTVAGEISKAIDVFDQFVAKVAAYFPKSLAADPAWVTANIHSPTAADAIFENLLCRQYPSRSLFIRPINSAATDAFNAVRTTLAGTPTDAFEQEVARLWSSSIANDIISIDLRNAAGVTQERSFDQVFPSIALSLSALFKNVTGDLEVLPAGAQSRQFIGLAIGTGANQINVQSVPGAAVTPKADALRTALGANFDRLKLRMMTPAQSIKGAAVKAKILLMLVYVDTSSWRAGVQQTASDIAARYVKVLNKLDKWVGEITALTNSASLDAIYVANDDTIGARITEYILTKGARFIPAARTSAGDVFAQIDAIKTNQATTAESNLAGSYTDPQNFRAAPVRIGRSAYIDWRTANRYLVSRFLPASPRYSNSPITEQEINAEAAAANNADVSNIYDATYQDSRRGAGDITNMPLVVNAKARFTRGVGVPRVESNAAPEYAIGARRVVSGMPSLGSDSKRMRYGGLDYNSSIVGGSMTLAGSPGGNVPDFYTDDFDEELPENMKKTFRQLCSEYDGQLGVQFVALLFLFTPVTRQALEATINYNLLHPFDYIIARPHATYQTVASINLKPGAETGNTLIGNIQVTVGDDTTVQVIQAAVRFYQGAIIYEPKSIYVVPNSMVVGYYGGLGTGFIDPDPQKYNPRLGIFGETRDASIMVLAIPRHEKLVGTALSLSGQLVATEASGRTNILAASPRKYSYNTGAFYNRLWGFYLTRWNDFEYTVSGPGDLDIVPNTVVFSSMAIYRDPKTGQWTAGTSNSGHWHTDTVGPGMHAARIGHKSFPLSSQSLVRTVFSF